MHSISKRMAEQKSETEKLQELKKRTCFLSVVRFLCPVVTFACFARIDCLCDVLQPSLAGYC